VLLVVRTGRLDPSAIDIAVPADRLHCHRRRTVARNSPGDLEGWTHHMRRTVRQLGRVGSRLVGEARRSLVGEVGQTLGLEGGIVVGIPGRRIPAGAHSRYHSLVDLAESTVNFDCNLAGHSRRRNRSRKDLTL